MFYVRVYFIVYMKNNEYRKKSTYGFEGALARCCSNF